MAHYAKISDYTPEQLALWNRIKEHEGEELKTFKGFPFTYHVVGNELVISRKNKPIPRSSVNLAFNQVKHCNGKISGPKQLLIYGASYVFAIFKILNLIEDK